MTKRRKHLERVILAVVLVVIVQTQIHYGFWAAIAVTLALEVAARLVKRTLK